MKVHYTESCIKINHIFTSVLSPYNRNSSHCEKICGNIKYLMPWNISWKPKFFARDIIRNQSRMLTDQIIIKSNIYLGILISFREYILYKTSRKNQIDKYYLFNKSHPDNLILSSNVVTNFQFSFCLFGFNKNINIFFFWECQCLMQNITFRMLFFINKSKDAVFKKLDDIGGSFNVLRYKYVM